MQHRRYANVAFCVVGAALVLVAADGVQAAIVSIGGMMTSVCPPLDLRLDQYEQTLAVFMESEHEADDWLMYDYLVPPPGPNPAGPYQGGTPAASA